MKNIFKIVLFILSIWLIIFFVIYVYSQITNEFDSTSTAGPNIIDVSNSNPIVIPKSKPIIIETATSSIATSSISVEVTPSSTLVTKQGIIKLEVPFTTQAPFAEWDDERQQNACEESAGIMAMAWVEDRKLSKQEARDEIVAISDWEMANYGVYQDTSAIDTVDRIFKGYFEYDKVKVIIDINSQDIINELEKGNLVITPVNGRELGNPNFVEPGPLEHMIVIIGYDYGSEEFITNESGTRLGKDYRYDRGVLFNAIRDYPTGYHEPITGIEKVMIVVEKK